MPARMSFRKDYICESRMFFHVRTMRLKRCPERYRRNDPAGDPDRYESVPMLKRAQSSFFRPGGRAHADFSGIQSVRSDAVAQTCLTGKPNFLLGSDGSRTFSGITDDGMVMGFPAEMLPEIVDAVRVIARVPGVSKNLSSLFRFQSTAGMSDEKIEIPVQSLISQAATSVSWAS